MCTLSEQLAALVEMGPGSLERFAATLDPAWIQEALEATGTASCRRRKFPAEQALWLVIGMGVFADRSIRDVVDHLSLVLPKAHGLAPSAISQARYRLGEEPLLWLFHRTCDEWAVPAVNGTWRGLELYGIDGSNLRVQDTAENAEYFGRPGGRNGKEDSGYPQIRLAMLMHLSAHLVVDASVGPYDLSEHALTEFLVPSIPNNSLTLVDRGLHSYRTFAQILDKGENRHFLLRLRAGLQVKILEVCDDGSALAELHAPPSLRRDSPGLRESIRVRVIDYHNDQGEPGRLITSLLDPTAYPAREIIDLYHERWELELAFDEIKTHMRERAFCLRSKFPQGVYQEFWGLMLTYNLVRREMYLVAQAHGVPPTRVSFRSSLLWIRTFFLLAWRTAPGNVPQRLADLHSSLDVLILPPRRSKRRYPRQVKTKMSNYPRNRGKRAKTQGIDVPSDSA